MSDRCELCGEKVSLERPGRSVGWVHEDCWEGVSREEIVGSREVDGDLLEAARALVAREGNHGDWVGGVPLAFFRLAERLDVCSEDVNWVLIIEGWVKRMVLREFVGFRGGNRESI